MMEAQHLILQSIQKNQLDRVQLISYLNRYQIDFDVNSPLVILKFKLKLRLLDNLIQYCHNDNEVVSKYTSLKMKVKILYDTIMRKWQVQTLSVLSLVVYLSPEFIENTCDTFSECILMLIVWFVNLVESVCEFFHLWLYSMIIWKTIQSDSLHMEQMLIARLVIWKQKSLANVQFRGVVIDNSLVFENWCSTCRTTMQD